MNVSNVSMSLLSRLMMRPVGVVSKNDSGAASNRRTSDACAPSLAAATVRASDNSRIRRKTMAMAAAMP